ncbi:MAG: amino acid permease [Bacteroidetes bacterium]|nr:amino acid permease [Bacteroidota bacterium]
MENNKYSKVAALSTVIANMIGVGVFSSLGFQVVSFENGGIPDGFSILLIWLLGGLIALCGAFTYSEVATTLKRSGGEYVYLSKLYHPSIGFASGWISLVVGFAGAIASAGLAIGKYSAPALGVDVTRAVDLFGFELSIQKISAIGVILFLSSIHLFGTKVGGLVQSLLTAFKIALILVFCFAPFFIVPADIPAATNLYPTETSLSVIFSFSFASALVWVMYAYSGWNAVVYIAGNVENPIKTIPFVLIGGTLLVTILYVLLNASFMSVATFEEMAGKEDIGNIVALKLFGKQFEGVFSAIFSFALFSTMSAMIIAGPRVSEQIGNDFSFFKKIAVKNASGTPVYAILLQALISISLVLFSSFQELIQTLGITLSFFSLLTVLGIFIIRKKYSAEDRPVKTWGYPITPILFILATLWMIFSFVLMDPIKIWYAACAIIPGVLVYFLVQKK